MSLLRFVARIILVAVVCGLTTRWAGWVSLPFVGFIYGVADRRARARGSIAALGAALGWVAILGAEAARGADIRGVAQHVGQVMQVPALAFILITLVFAALLSGTAGVLGAAIARLTTKHVDRSSPVLG